MTNASSFAGLSRHPAQSKPVAPASPAPVVDTPAAANAVAEVQSDAKPRCEGCTGHGHATQENSSCATVHTAAPDAQAVINSAIAPAALAMVADATPVAKPVTLHVVTGHSTPQFAQILSGVVGSCADGQFTIDPIYQKVAYLFTLAGAGLADAGTRLAEVTLPNEAAANEFIVNMIASSGASWDAMYEAAGSAIGNQGDIGKSMIAAEKAQVQRNVLAVVQGANLTSFDIPVTYEAYLSQSQEIVVSQEEQAAFTEQKLAASATVASLTIQQVPDAPIYPSEITAAVAQTPLSAESRAHEGAFQFEVTGVAKILASSGANAQAIFSGLLSISNSMPSQNVLTLAPVMVNNMTLTPYESSDDGYPRDN